MKHVAWAVGAVVGMGVVSAEGAVFTLDAVGRGWYWQSGESNGLAATNNYIAGNHETRDTFRNMFAFDLSAIGAGYVITGAQLRLSTGPATFFGAGVSETYTLFDVTTDVATLAAGVTSVGAYDDLGSGIEYGSRVYTSADTNTTAVIDMTEAFVGYANAKRGGAVVIGGAVTTLDANAGTKEYLFGNTHDTPASGTQLVLTTAALAAVPEPGGAAVLSGLAVVGVRRRRRR